MAAPIITLTTDFGVRDPFVGVMKGVILGICRGARLVDLTHDIAPQDVVAGALALRDAWPFFPAGTIHLAVVDPGVGSARRALALSANGHYFVGPDNGLFTFALGAPDWSAVSIEAPIYRLPQVSQTYHGRDIFAPAAGHLAAGVDLERLGPALHDPERIEIPSWRVDGAAVVGQVIGNDRFGNRLTSVPADRVRALASRGRVTVELEGRDLGAVLACYADGAAGIPAPIIGSTGRLEVFVKNGSAFALLGAKRGAPVRITNI